MIIENFTVTLTYEVRCDEQTGEIETKLIKKAIDKAGFTSSEIKCKNDNNPLAQVVLVDNKLSFNNAAISMLGLTSDSKVDIKYKKIDNQTVPILDITEGNKVTKSGTVSFRGSKNTELSKYGTVFIIEKQDDRYYILKGDKDLDILSGDNNVFIDKAIDDLDLSDLEEAEDITNSYFKFN